MNGEQRARRTMAISAIVFAVSGALLMLYATAPGGDEAGAGLGGFLCLIAAGLSWLLAHRNGIRVLMLALLATFPALVFALFGTHVLDPWEKTRGEATVIGTITAISGAITAAVWLWIAVQIVRAVIRLLTGPKADAPPPPLPPP
ncbi:MAG TPA: hypothetical protein VM733_21690 [Thermoanaerobaculia bacterium]|nr:hypothetical protein [Thermoanaerobaculia bacterium]